MIFLRTGHPYSLRARGPKSVAWGRSLNTQIWLLVDWIHWSSIVRVWKNMELRSRALSEHWPSLQIWAQSLPHEYKYKLFLCHVRHKQAKRSGSIQNLTRRLSRWHNSHFAASGVYIQYAVTNVTFPSLHIINIFLSYGCDIQTTCNKGIESSLVL